MKQLIIQIKRGEDWNKLTTVHYDPNREKMQRVGDTTLFNQAGATREAIRCLTAWAAHYTGESLRVVAKGGYGEKDVVVLGWGN